MISHRLPSYLNAAWANQWSAGTFSSSTTFTIAGNVTSAYVADNAIRILNAGTLYYSYIVSATFSTNTTIVIADAVLVSGSLSSDYSILPGNSAVGRGFQEVKVVGGRGFSVWNGGSQTASLTQAGVMTAVSFVGNGTSLTNLTWGNIVGVPSLVNSFNGRTGAVVPAANDYALSALATVSISAPSSGQVLQYNGTSWVNATLAAAPVSSVFGRTGAVTAQVGDYSSFYGQLAAVNTWTTTNTFNGLINYGTLSGGNITCKNGTSEADIYFGPNASYLYSNTGIAFGVYDPTSVSTLFSLSYAAGNGIFKGTVTATTFSGSGASLTNLPWGSLTGVPSLVNSFNGRTGAVVPAANDYALSALATVSISAPTSGQILTFNGSSWVNAAAPSVPVTSVFGRTGAVTAQVGDYSAWYAQFAASNTFSGSLNIFNNQIRVITGSCGNYSSIATAAWGGPIWGMDTGYTGGVGAANWSPSGVYGISWQRSGSTNANANIGEGLYVYVNGSLYGGIGTTGIYTSGTIVNSGVASFNTSSLDIKTNVHKLDFDIENFMRYEPISYVHKDSQLSTDGFSAENIYEVNPKLVMLKDGKPYAVNYQGMIPHAVKVGQKHELDLRESKERISYLENRIQNLENKLNKLVN